VATDGLGPEDLPMTRRRWTAILMILGAFALLAAGCGDDDDGDGDDAEAAAGGGVTAEDLDGRSFTSTELSGRELVDGSEIVLTFEDGNISAVAGCNSMSGGYSIDEDELEVGELAQTMMACDEELMAQDDWLAAFLADGPTIQLEGDVLTLSDDGTTLTATAG
jgi:heat shock protein HslJ